MTASASPVMVGPDVPGLDPGTISGQEAEHALLIVAHGSARYPEAAGTVLMHADAIRMSGRFAAVAVGLLNGAPSVADALASLGPRPIDVVPFFMEDGYFTRVAVPKALGSAEMRLYPAVGTHPGMAKLILGRTVRAGLAPDTLSLVLVGHGSARSPGRRMALHDHAARLRARFAAVHVAFLEEQPSVKEVLSTIDGPAAVLGVFAGEGMHVRVDLPALLAAAPGAIDLGSLGDEVGLAALIADLVLGGSPPGRTQERP